MTLGSLSGTEGCFCSCCGAKMTPYFSEDAVASQNQINRRISESFLTVRGAALFLPRGHGSSPNSAPHISQRRDKHTGDLQQHLQTMFTLLRPEDNIRLAVRLESAYPQCTRYMVVVSTNGRQDTEESVVLGMDFTSSDCSCTLGLVLPLWSDSLIHLDGDGGFSVSTASRVHLFKPVSVQAMWSALQSLHKACEVARCHNYYPGSLFLTWVSYYQSHVTSNQQCVNEWNAMQDVQSHHANSPILFTDVPTERERTERLVKTRLREIMMQKDLENVTSKEIRTELEMHMVCDLREFKEFIDNEMIVILGQMESPTEIFDHLYLGSEWNASNLEELQNSGVQYILNVTREIDNFFPGLFEYHNIRVYDEEATNLLEYWNDTYKFISRAKRAGAKCLVHCKMGVSRSASTVIAYAMKEYGWDLERAFQYVKERRAVTKPNPSFMRQLEEYQGILLASKQRHNKLWRSHSESDLSDRPKGLLKPVSHPHNNNNINTATSSPSLHHFLGVAALQVLGVEPQDPYSENGLCDTTEEEEEEEQREDPSLPGASCVAPDESRSRVVRAEPLLLLSSLRGPSLPGLSLNIPEETSTHSDTVERSPTQLEPVAVVTGPLSPSPVAAPGPRDNNNNPSHFQTGSVLDSPTPLQGSSGSLSNDSIDFFSAREKFVGLTSQGRGGCLSDQAQRRTPPSLSLEDPGETVTQEDEEEEEGVPQIPLHTNLTCSKPSQDKPNHHHDDDSLTPPSHPVSPCTPSFDWPAGSVRRATRQLEERLKQEQETPPQMTQRSPLHSPGSELPANQSLLPSPSSELPANQSLSSSPSCELPANSSMLYSPSSDHSANRTPLSSSSDSLANTVAVCSEHPANQTAWCWPTSDHHCVRCLPEPSHSPNPLTDLPQQHCLSPGQSLAHGEGPSGGLHPKESPRQLQRSNSSDMDTLPDPSSSPSPEPGPPTPDLSIPTTEPLFRAAMVLSPPVSVVETLDLSPDRIQSSGSPDRLLLGARPPDTPTVGPNLQCVLPSQGREKHGLEQGGDGLEQGKLDIHQGKNGLEQGKNYIQQGKYGLDQGEDGLEEAIQRLEQGKEEPQQVKHEMEQEDGLEQGNNVRRNEKLRLDQVMHGLNQVMHGLDQVMHGLEQGDHGLEQGKHGLDQGKHRLEQGKPLQTSCSQGNCQTVTRTGMGSGSGIGLGSGHRPSRATALGWQRALELEARIRQAGLTPPSQLKRSASLAKLDRLELSAADLSQWELRASPASLAKLDRLELSAVDLSQWARRSVGGTEEAWRKPRVLGHIPPCLKEPSSPLSSALHHRRVHQRGGNGGNN